MQKIITIIMMMHENAVINTSFIKKEPTVSNVIGLVNFSCRKRIIFK